MVVGLLDLVVIVGYVGLLERERVREEEREVRDGREERQMIMLIVYII